MTSTSVMEGIVIVLLVIAMYNPAIVSSNPPTFATALEHSCKNIVFSTLRGTKLKETKRGAKALFSCWR